MASKIRKLKDSVAAQVAAGRPARALQLLQQILQLDPEDVAARQKCGDLFLKLGRKGEAITAYRSAVEAYAAAGHQLKAIAVCKVILQIDPGHSETLEVLARLAAANGRPHPVGRRRIRYARYTRRR